MFDWWKMRIDIVIGGAAGQGINKISQLVSDVMASYGYYSFNYRDYPSLIRGGHNFNKLSFSDEPIYSNSSEVDIIVAMDDRTLETHKKSLKKSSMIITYDKFKDSGRNLNIALAGALIKVLGLPLEELVAEVGSQFINNSEALEWAKKGFDSFEKGHDLEHLNRKINILSGSEALAIGAARAGLDIYISYPMTPSTNALHAMAKNQVEKKMLVFQPENEIAVASMAIGASYAGAKVMVGTSGGGFDLMTETLSFQGMSEIPLVVYLASRHGPGIGVPTYTMQGDLDDALRSGHGEFPRFVVAPGTPVENVRLVGESLYLSEKFRTLGIILSDKHLAESEFSSSEAAGKFPTYKISRKIPGKEIVKASSYECDKYGNSTEEAKLIEYNANKRLEKYSQLKKYIKKNFAMVKIHGNLKSKNLIIGWGSTTGAILDSMKGLDAKFLQVIYMKPMSDIVKKEIERAKNVVLVENNLTGQLGRLIREKTGISIKNRVLRYDGRPFNSDELHLKLKKVLK